MKYFQKSVFLFSISIFFFSCTVDSDIAEEESLHGRALYQQNDIPVIIPNNNSTNDTGDDGGVDDPTEKG